MERREERHCSIAKQTILTTHPSGLQTRVSVELANFDCLHTECATKPRRWDSPFLARRLLGSSHNTPVLGRRSDAVNEGRLSQQCTPVMKRRVASPGGSPLAARRGGGEGIDVDALGDMENTVVSGWLKFRDNKRWKSRWGVVTKLSPAADCLHLQLYREPGDARRSCVAKAALSLQHFLGFESGFTLDREAHTLALLCADHVAVMAFDSRERLINWQVKVGNQLGASQEFVVVVPAGVGGGGDRGDKGDKGDRGLRLPCGPARLHVRRRRLALAAGCPPAVLAVWDLPHLRRYGVVEGRFAWEAGARCGLQAGAFCVASDRAEDIRRACDQQLRPLAASRGAERDKSRPQTRLSGGRTVERSLPDTSSGGVYEENFLGDDCEGVSPYWPDPPDERDHVTLERCGRCLSELGTGGGAVPFSPAWTMEAESGSEGSEGHKDYLTPRQFGASLREERPPERPPKPARPAAERQEPPADHQHRDNPRAGPYENYDVPKTAQVHSSDYYDTPKRIKRALTENLFQVSKSSSPGSLVLKKTCGCILKFGSKKKPLVVECEEAVQPVDCPCLKVTNWANNLISLPYCRKDLAAGKISTEIVTQQKAEEMAIYATVDVSRKTNRQSSSLSEKDVQENIADTAFTNYQNIQPDKEQESECPYANYENLEFALSLEYYENAKDLLKKAGVTQSELDALSANVHKAAATTVLKKQRMCFKCKHSQEHKHVSKSDEYLLMEPAIDMKRCQTVASNPGYTPMCPKPNWSQSLRYPLQKADKVEIGKCHSISALNGNSPEGSPHQSHGAGTDVTQHRSNSVHSADSLEHFREFESSVGSRATSSSLETLRNMATGTLRPPPSPGGECLDCRDSPGSGTPEGSFPEVARPTAGGAQAPAPSKAGNRDSSSSNDSGVSSCGLRAAAGAAVAAGPSRATAPVHRRLQGCPGPHGPLPRKSRSEEPLPLPLRPTLPAHKSSSAEAEVPLLPPKHFKGVSVAGACPAGAGLADGRSTSSGTSDMSDYMETLSMTSSHSSAPDTPPAPGSTSTPAHRPRPPTSTLRPRSGKEYHVTAAYSHLP